MCLRLFVCLSACLAGCLPLPACLPFPACLAGCLSVRLFVSLTHSLSLSSLSLSFSSRLFSSLVAVFALRPGAYIDFYVIDQRMLGWGGVAVSVCRSVCLSVCLSVSPSCLFVCLFVCLSVCLSVSGAGWPFLFVGLFVCFFFVCRCLFVSVCVRVCLLCAWGGCILEYDTCSRASNMSGLMFL